MSRSPVEGELEGRRAATAAAGRGGSRIESSSRGRQRAVSPISEGSRRGQLARFLPRKKVGPGADCAALHGTALHRLGIGAAGSALIRLSSLQC